MKKLLLFTALLLFIPLFLIILINVPIFKFAPGSTNSWITFWGSYLGALIGAATVYLVTSMQVKEQRKIQLDSIKEENNNAFNREMQQYYFKTQIDKIEEFYQLIEQLTDLLIKSSNEFTRYVTYTHILYGGEDKYTEVERLNLEEEIKKIRQETHNWIHNINRINFQLDRLTLYVEGTSSCIKEIDHLIQRFCSELKKESFNNYSFKKYLNHKKRPPLNNLLDEVFYSSSKLTLILQKKLEDKLKEMKSV